MNPVEDMVRRRMENTGESEHEAAAAISAYLSDVDHEPTTRIDAFGRTVCADCGYTPPQHGENCHA